LRENNILDGQNQNARLVRIYAGLVNNFVYHETADLLCEGDRLEPEIRQKRIERVITEADECLKLSKSDLLLTHERTEWYNLQETAAFAFMRLGDDSLRREGRRIIAKIFAGDTPRQEFSAAPAEWLRDIWDEYFTRDDATGLAHNYLGLDIDPIPARP
jgi:hypothetical protein